MRWLFVLVGAVGCGFTPGVYRQGADAAGGSDDALGPDLDKDGVADATDNCPSKPNPDQRNHDGDPRGDACDLCPPIATSPDDPDADGDLVGDACDPRPTAAGDRFAFWEGFYESSSITSWGGAAGWQVVSGWAKQPSQTADLSVITVPVTVVRHSVLARVRIDVVGVAGNDDVPGVGVAGGTAVGRAYACSVAETDGWKITAVGRWFDGDSLSGSDSDASWTGTAVAGSELVLHGRVIGDHHRCNAVQGTADVPVMADRGPTNGGVELLTTRMAASFDYVYVVEVGP